MMKNATESYLAHLKLHFALAKYPTQLNRLAEPLDSGMFDLYHD